MEHAEHEGKDMKGGKFKEMMSKKDGGMAAMMNRMDAMMDKMDEMMAMMKGKM